MRIATFPDKGRAEELRSPNALIRKLGNFADLSADDQRCLDRIARERVQHVRPREDMIREGDSPETVNVVLAGWACRYKALEDGRRQIVGLFLPGDTCDSHAFLLREMDHSVGAITALTYAEITRDAFERIARENPVAMRALHWETLVTAGIQREWTFNLGSRSAFERLAHLFCELYYRMWSVGLTKDGSFDLPLTQVDLGELAGLSAVHVNRTLQQLRGARLIVFSRGVLMIPDLTALQKAAFFSPNYLHLGPRAVFDATNARGSQ